MLSQFVSLLTGTAGFEPEIVEKSTYYASANRQFALLLASGVNERPCVKIIFYGPEILPIREYPGAAISAYLNGVSDTMLSLDTAGATGYDLTTGVRGQTLNVYLPLTVDGYAAANAVRDRFTNADYTMMDFNIMAEDGVSMRFADCLVSPNKEIAVFVFGYTAENMVEWFGNDVDYTYYYAEIVNLKNYANVAFMNGIRAELYKYIYEVGENFYFNGNIYGVYSDKSEKQLYVEDCIISEPDMNTSGTKTVTITLRKNPELTATVTITVSAANAITGISVSQYRTTYNIGDRFDKSCTVTALYSDGSTSEIRYTACNFTEPDMNTAGTKEITVTYPTNGNVLTATMSITVNERRVNGEGGVG